MLPGFFESRKPPTRFGPRFLKALGKHVASYGDSRNWNDEKGLERIAL